MSKNKNTNINIRCTSEDLAMLKWLVKLMEKSQGEIVRDLIRQEYDRVMREVSALLR